QCWDRQVSARGKIAMRRQLRQLHCGYLAEWGDPAPERERPVIRPGELRELVDSVVDFERVNAGSVRIVLGAVNLATGAETYFDNDRHVIGPEHVLASTAMPGMPPTLIDHQRYGGSAVSVAALDEARPADTLCFVIDG